MTNWQERTQPIQVGMRVGYSKAFLQSTGQLIGDVPFARGEVTAVVPIGQTLFAEVRWDTPDLPSRVNVRNLATVSEIARGE